MKKRSLIFLFLLLFILTGCRTEFDNNNTKLSDMSFNKPIGYRDSRYPIGVLEDGREYEMRVYEFQNFSISITWRDKDTFKKYSKDSDLKYKNKKINNKEYKYVETDNKIYYISEHMKGLYIFEFSGDKSSDNVDKYMNLLNNVKYRK